MGSPCRLVVAGGSTDLVHQARVLVDRLGAMWSRFVDSSEVSQLNRNAGHLTVVSPETFELVSRATEAVVLTGGRFNPLMLTQLKNLGYRGPWQDGVPTESCGDSEPGSNEPIELVRPVHGVRLPAGVAFDPGGIGKGLAADKVTEFLIAGGATATSVELGGDLRVSGRPWFGPSWRIGVSDPFGTSADVATFTPDEGAVATSSRLKRSWVLGGQTLHHLLDPETGEPADTDVVAVTACAAETWRAEVAAKVALMAGASAALAVLDELGTPGLIVTADGAVRSTAPQGNKNTERTRELMSQ